MYFDLVSAVNCAKMSDKEYCEESWMNGLEKKGLYYEGVVADLDDLLENYKRATVTTWGTRRSSTNTNGDLSDRVNDVSFNRTHDNYSLFIRPLQLDY